jgi:hypothetical protein
MKITPKNIDYKTLLYQNMVYLRKIYVVQIEIRVVHGIFRETVQTMREE